MDIKTVRSRIEEQKEVLHVRFRVKQLFVFGSVASGNDLPGSDVDFLVAFDGSYNYRQFLDLAEFLEEILGAKVDLVTVAALRPRLRASLDKEAIRVA